MGNDRSHSQVLYIICTTHMPRIFRDSDPKINLLKADDWYFFTNIEVRHENVCTCTLYQHYGYCAATPKQKTPIPKAKKPGRKPQKGKALWAADFARAKNDKQRALSVGSNDASVVAAAVNLSVLTGQWLEDKHICFWQEMHLHHFYREPRAYTQLITYLVFAVNVANGVQVCCVL